MDTSSSLINEAVEQLSQFPGVGKKSAFRMILHLLKRPNTDTEALAKALITMRSDIQYCKQCFNISDKEICNICNSPSRDSSLICVVKEFQDIVALETTGHYHGVYHVLGGLISPIDGVGPSDIKIPELLTRISENDVTEVILALSATLEGDTTEYYIAKKMTEKGIKVSTLSKGISVGGELEYADEVSLARSLKTRVAVQV
jgi:recombination protein RecR